MADNIFWVSKEARWPEIQKHATSADIGSVIDHAMEAEVNHCLSFEQVSDEIIEQYKIPNRDFDTITDCKYTIPRFMDIGKLYSIMIEDCAEPGKGADDLLKILSSFISDKISNFQSDVYYQSPSYLELFGMFL